MADVLVRASVRGAARNAAGLRGAKRQLQDELNREIRALGLRAQQTYSHPPPIPTATGRTADLRDTGHALNSVQAIPYFRAARVRMRLVIDATRDGFNYLEAMRHGQRPEYILARERGGRRGFMSVHLSGRNQPPVHLRRVRAFRPMLDFVEESHLRFAPEVDDAERRLERRIDAVFVETR